MCVVSNVGDYYKKNFDHPWYPGGGIAPVPNNPTTPQPIYINNGPTKAEFEALKAEVEELKKLLQAAKKFDDETNQHQCHQDEKVEFIKRLAEYVGVDLGDVFGS